MTPDQTALMQQLDALAIDPPGITLSFVDRLARDNGWSRGYAARVMREYRRFLLLAATAGHQVTPSDAVDQAWHQHLTYSRSYWDDLCGRVLGFALHHGPTAGGAAEDARYADQYARTLVRYTATFGETPPADIWPDPATRFAARFARIDRRAMWVVPKRAAAVVALAPVAAIGLTASQGKGGLIVGIVILAILGVIIALAARASAASGRRGGNESSDGGMLYGNDGSDGHHGGHHGGHGSPGGHDSGGHGGDAGGGHGCGSSGCGGGGCGGGH